jgi:hypothetical protein
MTGPSLLMRSKAASIVISVEISDIYSIPSKCAKVEVRTVSEIRISLYNSATKLMLPKS